MPERKLGLLINHEDQSRDDLLAMIMQGDRFIAKITNNGEDTDLVLEIRIASIDRWGRGPGKHSLFLIESEGNSEAGIKTGSYKVVFSSSLFCDQLPATMLESIEPPPKKTR